MASQEMVNALTEEDPSVFDRALRYVKGLKGIGAPLADRANEAMMTALGPQGRKAVAPVAGLANVITQGADLRDMVDFSGKTVDSVRSGDLGGAAINAIYTAAAPIGMALPGSVGGYKKSAESMADSLMGVADDVDPTMLAKVVPIEPGDTRVSTRFPTAVKAPENPLREHLNIGVDEARATPAAYDHNANLLAQYPGYRHLQGRSADEQVEGYIDQSAGNMDFLVKNSPQVLKDRAPFWYDGANDFAGNNLAQRYGVPRQSVSAAVASLSPQKDWFQNASLAERVGDVMFGSTNKFTSEMADIWASKVRSKTGKMDPIFERLAGKKFDQLDDPVDQALWIRLYDEAHNPRSYRGLEPEGGILDVVTNADGSPRKVAWGSLNEISKAVEAYKSGGDMDVISALLGKKHKVRSFYNNIEVPNDARFGDITADTHQVAAAQMRPLSGGSSGVLHSLASSPETGKKPVDWAAARNSAVSGVQGTYPMTADATRRAAAMQEVSGMLPRNMQSTSWEAVRELFPRDWKNASNAGKIDKIWSAFDDGSITLDQARRFILDASPAGGISTPSWAKSGSQVHGRKQSSTYRGDL
jgi:hypothetical protein